MQVNYALLSNGKVIRFEDSISNKKKSDIEHLLIACNHKLMPSFWVKIPYSAYKFWKRITKENLVKLKWSYEFDFEMYEDYSNNRQIKESFTTSSINRFFEFLTEAMVKQSCYERLNFAIPEECGLTHAYLDYVKVNFIDKNKSKKLDAKKFLVNNFGKDFKDALKYMGEPLINSAFTKDNPTSKCIEIEDEQWKLIKIKNIEEDFNLMPVSGFRHYPIYISVSNKIHDIEKITFRHYLLGLGSDVDFYTDQTYFSQAELDDLSWGCYVTKLNKFNTPECFELLAYRMYEYLVRELRLMSPEDTMIYSTMKVKFRGKKLKRLPFHVKDPNNTKHLLPKDDSGRIKLTIKANKRHEIYNKPEPSFVLKLKPGVVL